MDVVDPPAVAAGDGDRVCRETLDRDLRVRTRSLRGGWSPWREVHPLHEDGPDPGSREARGADAQGSDLVWVGESDGFQVRTPGGRPRDLEVVLIDPGTRPADHAGMRDTGRTTGMMRTTEEPEAAASVTARRAARGSVPRPRIRFRKGWGADEALRDGQPTYNTTMKQGHVHHTAGSNDYRRADVPAIIRGIYAYHTRSLGWSDIGYNFVVDRFGEIWVGRAGGPRRNVRGAHTRGFNHQSFGVAALGSFDDKGPSSALVRGIARLSAWKLDRAGRRPAGTVWTTSHGSDKYPSGRRLQLPVLDGHRDTGATACPGELLYDRLGVIRARAQTRVDTFS